jgi:hypothetical protein
MKTQGRHMGDRKRLLQLLALFEGKLIRNFASQPDEFA